ncbi:TlpA family protein disulfide reductase [Sphingobacterium endophyticum]|uniref:TlpA family protein disulfide reductase n=1 Tax=Sphingobacterium endophyticum TaxID=2546448 RepID=UPI0012E0E3BC|nr:hypothetical protein [Sphingobacterium endophyticum]
MKNIIPTIILVFTFVSSSLAQVPKEMPSFSKFINLYTGELVTSDSINKKHTQVFILFDAGCGHCQELGQGISLSLDKIRKNVDFYFVSMQEKALVDGYINMFAKGLRNDSRVKFLYDKEGEFILNFHPTNFPSTYIFEAESLQLIKQFDGENKVNSILPFLEKPN